MQRFFLLPIAVVLLLLWVACPSPSVVDTPASNLDVITTVLDTTANPSDGKVPAVMQFLINGKIVQFGSNVTVTCNGVTLNFNGLGQAGRVPMVPVGGTYTFVYTRNGTPTTVTVTVPSRPGITAPASGATITRTNNLSITYTADGGVGVRGGGSDGSSAVGGGYESDNGNYTGLNVTSLKAGAGSVYLTRDLSTNVSGSGFKSYLNKYTTGSPEIPVTWQ